MKTWFDKNKQMWVSEIPNVYWLGIYDYRTGKKIYSDEGYYWSKSGENWNFESKITKNAKEYYKKYKKYPHTFSNANYMFKLKNIK